MKKAILAIIAATVLLAGGGVVPASAAERPTIIKGHVYSVSGKPLAGVSVEALPHQSEQGGTSDTTSKTGRFEIHVEFDGGKYDIRAYAKARSGYANSAKASVVSVKTGKSVKVNKRLEKAATISGSAVNPDGTPAAGVTVLVGYVPYSGEDAEYDAKGYATTNKNGEYSLEGLNSGDWTVFFRTGANVGNWYLNAATEDAATVVSVRSGQTVALPGVQTVVPGQ